MTSSPAGVSGKQRFHQSNPCPVCSGYNELPQGQGRRCYGFLSSDGLYAHCTREEKAGEITQGPDATFAHRLKGSCKCGVQHGPDFETSTEPEAVYLYTNERGIEFEKGRFPKANGDKTFSWRQRGTPGWPRGSTGAVMAEFPLYGVELLGQCEPEELVIFVEGEKAQQSLVSKGYIAVCGAGGGSQRRFGPDDNPTKHLEPLRGFHVALWPDSDQQGEAYVTNLSKLLQPIAASIRLIRWRGAVPGAGDDAYDFWNRSGTREELDQLLAGVIPEEEAAAIEPQLPVAADYCFKPASMSTFVLDYIEYRKETSDAPLEYAEALALGLLSAVVGPRLRIPLRTEPVPLNTSLYILLLGPSSVYRKSNSINHARMIVEEVVPAAIMSTPGSPEGFVQDMGLHWESGALWIEDEFASTFQRMKKPYYADIRGWILRMYDGFSISRRNRTKKTKQGDVADVDVVRDPALTFLSGATPGRLAEMSNREDIEDGFWPRWIVAWPTSRPPFQLIGPPSQRATGLRNVIRNTLGVLHEQRLGIVNGTVQAVLDDAAWKEAEKVERRLTEAAAKDEANGAFYVRAITRVFKVAALLALVEDVDGKGNVHIGAHHVTDASALVDRWLADMLRFAETVGLNEFEKQVDKAWRALKRLGGTAHRRQVSIASRVSKRLMDEIESTLVDRGLLEVMPGQSAGSLIWRALEGQKE